MKKLFYFIIPFFAFYLSLSSFTSVAASVSSASWSYNGNSYSISGCPYIFNQYGSLGCRADSSFTVTVTKNDQTESLSSYYNSDGGFYMWFGSSGLLDGSDWQNHIPAGTFSDYDPIVIDPVFDSSFSLVNVTPIMAFGGLSKYFINGAKWNDLLSNGDSISSDGYTIEAKVSLQGLKNDGTSYTTYHSLSASSSSVTFNLTTLLAQISLNAWAGFNLQMSNYSLLLTPINSFGNYGYTSVITLFSKDLSPGGSGGFVPSGVDTSITYPLPSVSPLQPFLNPSVEGDDVLISPVSVTINPSVEIDPSSPSVPSGGSTYTYYITYYPDSDPEPTPPASPSGTTIPTYSPTSPDINDWISFANFFSLITTTFSLFGSIATFIPSFVLPFVSSVLGLGALIFVIKFIRGM